MSPRLVLPLVLCLLSVIPPSVLAGGDPAGAPGAPEARVVKAAYVYNFTKFVEWATEDGVADTAATVTICVVGSDPVGGALDEIASLQSKGRPIRVLHVPDRTNIPACHILYIGRSEEGQLAWILAHVGNFGVLTVSDIPRFAESGGMIGFTLERGRVRLEINAPRVRQAGLKVSSKLLEIARVLPEGDS